MMSLLTKLEEKVYAAEAGISYPQFLVLVNVASSEPPVTQTTIARRIQRELNSVSMLVDRMERLGLVTKSRSEVDRRETHVALTPLGKKKLARAIEVGTALRERLGIAFSEEEAQEGIRLTTKLRNQILKELGQKPAPAQSERDTRQRIIDVFKRGGAE
jgi:DNA-binding MarR family transcriptional regulator